MHSILQDMKLTTVFGVSTALHLLCIAYIITKECRSKRSDYQPSPSNLLLGQNYVGSILYMALLLVTLWFSFPLREYSNLLLAFLIHFKVNHMLGLTVQKVIAVFYPLKLKVIKKLVY